MQKITPNIQKQEVDFKNNGRSCGPFSGRSAVFCTVAQERYCTSPVSESGSTIPRLANTRSQPQGLQLWRMC